MIKIFACLLIFLSALSPAFSATPDEILAKMSIEEKVGQVIVGAFRGSVMSEELRASLQDLHFGGVIFFSGAGNVVSTKQVSALIGEINKISKLPLFISIDQEGGRVARIRDGVTVWSGNMALGATGRLDYAEKQAEIMARELRALGFNMNFAPVADVNSNPKNPVIGVRSFGSNPEEVSRFVNAMLTGFANGGIIPTVKHFPGHGDTATDSHYGLPRVDKTLAELERVELLPFRRAVEHGVPCVMTSHIIVPALGATDVPITLSKEALSFLRNEIGFKGLILTDALTGMKAIEDTWGTVEAGVMALNAGADLLIFGMRAGELDKIFPTQKAAHARIVQAVKTGALPISRLDDAVLRILVAKASIPTDCVSAATALQKSQDFADEIAQASITLIRDEKKLIPLNSENKKNIPLILNFGQKSDEFLKELPDARVLEVPQNAEQRDFDALVSRVKDSPVVVVVGNADIARKLDPKRLVYISTRNPYDIMSMPEVGTYIASYADGVPAMKAVARVLSGKARAAGKLPVEIE